ncbi:hypothetical protein JVX99_29325 [Pseudomonas aeruginosa]|uniref:hypothetical protein n=1 Tax=Pseudomonas aeruginosa TaxID=287 RepID=UPI00163C1BF1|nr:hypothetical protein [Pseudomonas aeruginosa]MCS8253054.1 hypothetical protein [Pseudomonas aeruginosa]MCS8259430.1 hypothetical protein [Pseudomonas aeruginosa]MCS8758404.1 hypothetical protein [Pseudomonas aeruginosa]QRY73893.1 hypothetical protein JVX99_29325 [Pseudomonas aeruginosa]WPS79277.1 hypothetical protein SPM78_18420 [Pseudomonas aeruginosa]
MGLKKLISELVCSGLTQYEIASLVGTSQPTISRAAGGQQVRYEVGKAIETLHEQRCASSADLEVILPIDSLPLQYSGSAVHPSSGGGGS